jgi:sec-independent protein translocase protein TatA
MSAFTLLAFLPNIGPQEMIIVLVIAVLLFGKRLPEVGRSLGKSIVEFKKGLQGIQNDVDSAVANPIREGMRKIEADINTAAASSTPSPSYSSSSSSAEHEEPTAPKFEPPPSEPKA